MTGISVILREAKNLSCSFTSFLRKKKRDASRDVMKARKSPYGLFARRAQNDTVQNCGAPIPAFVLCALTVVLALAAPAPARATIRYEISLAHPAQHQFHVSMINPSERASVTEQMQAWNALYQIRDFAYRVSDFRATDDVSHNPLSVRRLDKDTWRVEVPAGGLAAPGNEIRIEYASFWDAVSYTHLTLPTICSV